MGTLAFVMWLGMVAQNYRDMWRYANDGCWTQECSLPTITADIKWDTPAWKPLIVPAIQKKDWTFNEDTYYWDCADKTRILEHDQQNPPKYWCRAEMQ